MVALSKIRSWFMAICLTALLSGCGIENGMCPQANNLDGNITDGIMVTFSTDKDEYDSSENVQMSLAATNITNQTKTITFNSSQEYEFYVLNGAGAPVWQWSVANHIGFLTVMVPATIQPCDSYTFSETSGTMVSVTWNKTDNDGNPVTSGDYTVYGVLTADGGYESVRKVITLN